MKSVRCLVPVLAALVVSGAAQAQDYPSQPVRIVVPFAAGGTVDTIGRLIAGKLTQHLKQPVVIENRPGAAGNVAADAVAKSTPDGYTLLLATNGHAISPALYRKLPYDPVGDFAPITQLYASTLVLLTSKTAPMTSLKDMIAMAKAKPGSLNYGSTGVGNPLHLTMEMLKLRTGTDVVAVPYRGDAPMMTALIAGQVDLAVAPLPTAKAHIDAGSLRALGVAGAKRNPAVPDVPTIAEQGVDGFQSESWLGFLAPAKTPPAVVRRLHEEIVKVLNDPDVRERFDSLGLVRVGSTPDEFATQIKQDIQRFGEVVKQAKIPMQD